MQTTSTEELKKPKVLPLAFSTAMSERFGYYIIGFLMLLYVKAVYNFSDTEGFALFALFAALTHLMPSLGGYLSDNFIGLKRCLGLGLIVESIGFFILAIPGNSLFIFYIALGFIIMGSGLFKTTPTNLLGRSYEKGNPGIDSGFTLYYMGINIGSFSSSLVAGTMMNKYGFNIPFLIAAIGLLGGFVWFIILKHHGNNYESKAGKEHFSLLKWFLMLTTMLISIFMCAVLMSHTSIINLLFYACCIAVMSFLLQQTVISPKEDRTKIIACVTLISLSAGFHVLYFQLFQSIIFFVERCVDRSFLGLFSIPTATFPGINAISVIILSPILASIYSKLEKNNRRIPISTKFPIGLSIITFSFFLLMASTYFASRYTGQISSLWVVIFIALYSLAELLVAALGLAMITRIAPKRLYGLMMGVWFLIGSALAANFSGCVAQWAAVPEILQTNIEACLGIYRSAFFKMGLLGLAVTIVGFSLSPFLKKATRG